MLKIDRLEAHDRHKSFTNQDFSISDCLDDIIKKEPFGNIPFYVFAHSRTDDDGIRKRLIWQPRLTKPKAQTNSMLFRVYPRSDRVDVIWMIPLREMWQQYQKGKVCESHIVTQSIDAFEHKREELEAPDPSDLCEESIRAIYDTIAVRKRNKSMMDNLYLPKPMI